VCRHGAPTDLVNNMFTQAHHNATILAREKPVEGVKWARLDYLTEPDICTRWSVFRYVLVTSPHSSITPPDLFLLLTPNFLRKTVRRVETGRADVEILE
jgi:hypothetical protein